MTDSLITWKEETPEAETWAELTAIDENELHAFNRTAAEEAKRQAEASDLYTIPESELLGRWQQEAQKLEAVTLEQKQVDAVHRFLQATPEFVCNSKNQQRIDAYLKVAKLDASDPTHFDQAYRALSARNLLDVDESKRVRVPYQRHTEEDLERMDIAELERLARQTR
jgi:hypothetical protein